MERSHIHQEILQRWTTPSAHGVAILQGKRDEIKKQIDSYLKRGGKVQEVPYGIQRLGPGKYAVPADDFATPRGRKDHPRITGKNFIRTSEAAALLGISGAQFSHRIRKGTYDIEHIGMDGTAYIYKRADVLKLKRSKELQPCNKK